MTLTCFTFADGTKVVCVGDRFNLVEDTEEVRDELLDERAKKRARN